MKDLFRKVLWPLLGLFEKGDDPYHYEPSHRAILVVISLLFSGLALVVLWMAPGGDWQGVLFPVVVFLSVAFVALVVGCLGSDRAVAKLWGNRGIK